MEHLLYVFNWYQMNIRKKKNPIKSDVYRVLVLFDMLKVLEAGLEPAHPKILDFESSASTNSATRASGRQNYKKIINHNINQSF